MCCARTAALQGGTKCPCECHAGLPAAIKALSSKIVAKTAPRALQNPAGRHPKPIKIEPGGTHENPDATKSAQHTLKGAQVTPKSVPKLLKSCPRALQTRPRQAREAPKPLQNRARQAPRRVLAATVLGRLVRKAPRAFFCDFSRCARCLRPVFRSTKTVVLLHSEQSESASAHALQNLEK